jgi:hypothetical protein
MTPPGPPPAAIAALSANTHVIAADSARNSRDRHRDRLNNTVSWLPMRRMLSPAAQKVQPATKSRCARSR